MDSAVTVVSHFEGSGSLCFAPATTYRSNEVTHDTRPVRQSRRAACRGRGWNWWSDELTTTRRRAKRPFIRGTGMTLLAFERRLNLVLQREALLPNRN